MGETHGGFDISDNQGAGDWPTAAAHLLPSDPDTIVVVKVNEADYVSKQLHQQRMGAHAAGFRWVFLYDFARFDLTSGRAEAERFIADIGADGGLLLNEGVVLDLEVLAQRPDLSHSDLRAYVVDWVQVVAPIQSPGVTVLLYSSVEQLTAFKMFQEPSPLHDPRIKLWLVNLGGTTAPPVPFGEVVMIQTDWHGRVPGFVGDVDLDLFLGTAAQIKALTWGNQIVPGGEKLVAGKPDIALTDKGAAQDVTAAAITIAANLERARRVYGTRGTALDGVLATTQGDAVAVALVGGLLGTG